MSFDKSVIFILLMGVIVSNVKSHDVDREKTEDLAPFSSTWYVVAYNFEVPEILPMSNIRCWTLNVSLVSKNIGEVFRGESSFFDVNATEVVIPLSVKLNQYSSSKAGYSVDTPSIVGNFNVEVQSFESPEQFRFIRMDLKKTHDNYMYISRNKQIENSRIYQRFKIAGKNLTFVSHTDCPVGKITRQKRSSEDTDYDCDVTSEDTDCDCEYSEAVTEGTTKNVDDYETSTFLKSSTTTLPNYVAESSAGVLTSKSIESSDVSDETFNNTQS